MIPQIKEIFPTDESGRKYATLSSASVELHDMAECAITADVRISGTVVPDFSKDWAVEHDGHRYVMGLRKPEGSKDSASMGATYSLRFVHLAWREMSRYMFFTYEPVATGTASADTYIASMNVNLADFCVELGRVLDYYYGDMLTVDLNPAYDTYKAEPSTIELSHTFISDVLARIYEVFGVHWTIEPNGGPERYVIRIGYEAGEIPHIFKYGFEGGLKNIERDVQSDDIRNQLLGRGGDTNLPRYYFKKSPDEKLFRTDPDWVKELADIYFSRLHGATFRSYVQGWKAAHISEYPGYTAVGESNAYAPWAYRKGYEDAKWRPVEYVQDTESIEKYGVRMGGLEDNDEIYPTLRGVDVEPFGRLDEAVDVEQVTTDTPREDEEEASANTTHIGGIVIKFGPVGPGETYSNTLEGYELPEIPEGKTGNLELNLKIKTVDPTSTAGKDDGIMQLESCVVRVTSPDGKTEVPAVGIPPGRWRYSADVTVQNTDKTRSLRAQADLEPVLTLGVPAAQYGTFDIWVKNIWQTAKLSGESDAAYAERVWGPVLGDGLGGEAKVLFTTGSLAVSDDYEFPIVKVPEYDTSKSIKVKDENGINRDVPSHWRLTLGRSDADFEALGAYVPSTRRQGRAGDHFVFVGTEMTHEYTLWAERLLDDTKRDELEKVRDVQSSLNLTLDRVRISNYGMDGALIDSLGVGKKIRIYDPRLTAAPYETRFIQSLTYTYRTPSPDDTALNPDVEMAVGDTYETAANSIAMLQGDMSALQRQVGSIAGVLDVVRAYCDARYLRKDGIPDESHSPTGFFDRIMSGDFREGMVGGAGWGFFLNDQGQAVFEVDHINVRQSMSVNNLVINQVEARGGMIVESAAACEIERVEETDSEYVCWFNTRKTPYNLFREGDIAYCNRFDAKAVASGESIDGTALKFYRRVVTRVTGNNVVLSKSQRMGDGVPSAGDVIVQYGHLGDPNRQYVKVRDVVGGGYERYLCGLNRLSAAGREYYFVGRQPSTGIRFFVGDDGQYMEFRDGKLKIRGSLEVASSIGDVSVGDLVKTQTPYYRETSLYLAAIPPSEELLKEYWSTTIPAHVAGDRLYRVLRTEYVNGSVEISKPENLSRSFNTSDYLEQALKNNSTVEGGLISTSVIRTGFTRDSKFICTAGINGIVSADMEDPAFWAGGDALSSGSIKPAFVLYHNGTGYFASGAIVVNRDSIVVGGQLTLDSSGMRMMSGGNVCMEFSNTAVPAPQGVSQSAATVSFRETTTVLAKEAGNALLLGLFTSGKILLYGGSNIPADSYIDVTVRVSLGNQSLFSDGIDGGSIAARLEYRAPGTSLWGTSYVFPSSFGQNKSSGEVFATIPCRIRVASSGNYRIVVENSGAGITDGLTKTVTVTASGSVAFGTKDQFRVGNNGTVAVYGTSSIYIGSGGMFLRNGNHMLKFATDGIWKSSDGGSNWTRI